MIWLRDEPRIRWSSSDVSAWTAVDSSLCPKMLAGVTPARRSFATFLPSTVRGAAFRSFVAMVLLPCDAADSPDDPDSQHGPESQRERRGGRERGPDIALDAAGEHEDRVRAVLRDVFVD